MAKIGDLKLRYRIFMKTYRYRSADWGSGARLQVPLSEAKIAVVTTAALYKPEQEPFDEELKGGDPSFRVIEQGTDLSTLRLGHRSEAFDHTGVLSDANLALPLDRLVELQAEGRIGSINPRHFSFMGSITAPGRLLSKTAPETAQMLLEDQVDAVVLTPV
ncbi:MAG: selenoprotein B glycine/betaine/sarcosine/D-proline reductase [Acidobacteriota bacterium]|nr:MAG: selenoprotein B glycine/betaine/sarcosine/D-proline reductase [Acidobacteriota bacterium]